MANKPKRQCLVATTPMTSANVHLSTFCDSHDEEPATRATNNKRKNSGDIVVPSRTDPIAHGHAKIIENMKHIKQYAGRILHHDRSTIEFKPDGSFLVTPHFPQMPNEVVSMIIVHLAHDQKSLYQCTLVATQFYNIANPLLWRALDFRTIISFERFLVSINHVSPTRLANVGQHIRELRLCGPHCTDTHVSWPLADSSLLTPVSFHPPTPTVEACLLPLLPHCRHLTTLAMTFLPLGRLCFFTIGRNCTHLRDLEWHMCSTQTPEWLTMLRDCPLERLALSSIHTPLASRFADILQQFNGLTYLQIHDAKSVLIDSLLGASTSIIAAGLPGDHDSEQELSSASDDDDDNDDDRDHNWNLVFTPARKGGLFLPRLTTLILNPCDHINDRTLLCFIKMHPQLETLHLTNTKRLTNLSLAGMADSLPNLRHVTLTLNQRISSAGVRQFVCRCASLLTFKLYGGNVKLSDDIQAELEDTFYSSSSVALLNRWTMDWIRRKTDRWTVAWINDAAQENSREQQQQ